MNVAAGSYEGSIFGWDLHLRESEANTDEEILETRLNFGFHAAPGALKAVAVSGSSRYLATGGSDEIIRLFDTKENVSAGELAVSHRFA